MGAVPILGSGMFQHMLWRLVIHDFEVNNSIWAFVNLCILASCRLQVLTFAN